MKARRQGQTSKPRKAMTLRLDDDLVLYADQQAKSLGVTRSRWIAHLIAENGTIPGYEIDPPEDEDTKKEAASAAST
ncbi:hypothetical protein HF984_11145 [Rothia terrae]|uniref:hypothetical protein n=1 Tax=Rothia terrae TaxID=396015 RepID=UPI001696D88B|nr:hypothetical protein [Rothia terrae]